MGVIVEDCNLDFDGLWGPHEFNSVSLSSSPVRVFWNTSPPIPL